MANTSVGRLSAIVYIAHKSWIVSILFLPCQDETRFLECAAHGAALFRSAVRLHYAAYQDVSNAKFQCSRRSCISNKKYLSACIDYPVLYTILHYIEKKIK